MLPGGGQVSAPKSVVKVKAKNGSVSVEYTSSVDAAEYYTHELTRAALRDVGKYVCKVFRTSYYSHFTKRTGDAGKATKYKVISSATTTAPRVQIGLKTGKVPGFYAYFQEFGTKKGNVPQLGLLTHAVQDNIPQIVSIESQYLSGLSDEAARLAAMVDEADMEGDADD